MSRLKSISEQTAALLTAATICLSLQTGTGGASAAGVVNENEKNIVEVFKRVAPSVVSVANKALVSGLFGVQVLEVPQGAGSGFVWDKEGHIVSNFHVVEGASSIEVVMKDGTSYEASMTGIDPDNDIAVLKIDAPRDKLVPIPVGRSGPLQVGQTALAIGNPFGLDCSLSVGVVSSIGRSMRSMTDMTIYDVIQTDAAINNGNSGGPLLDSSGRLIGINSAIISPSGGSVGLGFAIPIDTISNSVHQLITKGRIEHAGLGVEFFPDQMATRYGITGVIARNVSRDGAGEKAGLRGTTRNRIGDIITGVDGKKTKSLADLRGILYSHRTGDEVEITYTRGEHEFKTKARLQTIE